MANLTVALLLRVKVDGKEPYLKVVWKNGRVKDKIAIYQGRERSFPDGVYAIRYKQNGKLVMHNVSRQLDEALAAKIRKETELEALATNPVIPFLVPEHATPAKREFGQAPEDRLDDVRLRGRREGTIQGYSSVLTLFKECCPEAKFVEDINRSHCMKFIQLLTKRGNEPRTVCNQLTHLGTLLNFYKQEMPLDGRDWPRYPMAFFAKSVDTLVAQLATAPPPSKVKEKQKQGSTARFETAGHDLISNPFKTWKEKE